LLLHFLEAVKDLVSYQITLFDPAFLSAGGANFREALFAIQHIDPVAVFGGTYLVVNLRQLVAQNDLRGRDVVDLKHPVADTIASCEEGRRRRQQYKIFPGTI